MCLLSEVCTPHVHGPEMIPSTQIQSNEEDGAGWVPWQTTTTTTFVDIGILRTTRGLPIPRTLALEDNEIKSLLPGYVLLAGGHPPFPSPWAQL